MLLIKQQLDIFSIVAMNAYRYCYETESPKVDFAMNYIGAQVS